MLTAKEWGQKFHAGKHYCWVDITEDGPLWTLVPFDDIRTAKRDSSGGDHFLYRVTHINCDPRWDDRWIPQSSFISVRYIDRWWRQLSDSERQEFEQTDDEKQSDDVEVEQKHFEIPRFFQYLPSNFPDEEIEVVQQKKQLQNFANSRNRRRVLRNQRVAYRGFIPSQSEKTHNSFFFSTAGCLACIKPCGIIVGLVEMLRAESPTLWGCLIGWLFDQLPTQFWPCGIIGDSVCGAYPRMKGLVEEGDVPDIWKQIFEHILYWMLDTFHSDAGKHSCRVFPHFSETFFCAQYAQPLVNPDQNPNFITPVIDFKNVSQSCKPTPKFANRRFRRSKDGHRLCAEVRESVSCTNSTRS